MRKVVIKAFVGGFTLCIGATGLASIALAGDHATIAVTSIVEHPSLNAVRDGLIARLKEAGYQGDRLKLVYETAQGQPSIAAQIARKFVGEAPDVIVAISTPSAQAAASATKDIPIVFSAVTDPVAAGLIKSFKSDGSGNVTGISDLSPVPEQLVLFKEIMPGLKRLGAPYNPGETNAIASVEQLKREAAKNGIEVVTVPANRTSDVKNAAQKLVGQVDAIYLLPDNTVVAAIDTVLAVGRETKIPVFSNDVGSVEKGAVATTGFSYFEVGRQTGDLVLRILNGTKPGTIDSVHATGTEIVVNKAAAAKFGITIPDAVATKAARAVD